MSLKNLTSFSSGELDPALHERTTLQKYKSALKTARNTIIGKTGRLVSRAGRRLFVQTKLSDSKVLIHPMSNSGSILEFGHLYFRVYSLDGTLVQETVHTLTEDDLDDIQFVEVKVKNTVESITNAILVLRKDEIPWLIHEDGTLRVNSDIYYYTIPTAPSMETLVNGGTGGLIDYAISAVIEGQESTARTYLATQNMPLTGEQNTFNIRVDDWHVSSAADIEESVTEIRVYRRPREGGAYGYIGSSTKYAVSGPDLLYSFLDFGQDADYVHSPIAILGGMKISGYETVTNAAVFQPKTALMYQQRLLMANREVIVTSRINAPGNFYRDFPLAADSALALNVSGKDTSEVLYMIESGGLLVFTRDGVYLHIGGLNTTNLSFDKKGDWVIDDSVPPIGIPGGVLFMDSTTNTVRQLTFSTESNGYIGEELSIFSDHLFSGNKVASWSFEPGVFPLLWVIFTDGTFASFTYERNHQMRAWVRHDSGSNLEQVISITRGVDQTTSDVVLPQTIFLTKKGTARNIEIGVPRYVSADIAAADSESDKNESIAAMDAMVSWSSLENDNLVGSDEFALVPVVAGVWDGDLTLTCGTSTLFPDPGNGAVGTIFRYFNPDDKTEVDLEVTARASDNEVTVSPSVTFPSEYGAANPRLYLTAVTFTGLGHLEGEDVSIISDGYVLASPNNDIENYPTVTVSSGAITLPASRRGAIVHIGRPFTSDIETLDIDTVEQRPTLIESKTLNKLYVKVHNSRGLYVGNEFSTDDKVDGMESLDSYIVNYEDTNPIIGNRYDQPQSKRVEMTVPGDWRSQGRVCIRQVDPLHFEILSIIPDLQDMRR